MSFNISYFLGTLPSSYDFWNLSTKLDYYSGNLEGFTTLNGTTQILIAAGFTYSDLQFLWSVYQNAGLAFHQGVNATQEFIQFIINPSTWDTYFPGEWTTSVPQNTTTPPTDPCLYVNYLENVFVVYMLIPAICVVLLLTLFKSRKKMCIKCFWGRPHLVYPVNFVDEHSHRWGYAMVFILITYKVLLLFQGGYFWSPNQFQNAVWMKTYGWTRVFVIMLNVAWMCLVYYPFLACLSLRRMLLANIVGLAYLAPWVWNSIHVWQLCPFWKKLHTNLVYDAVMLLVFDIPILIAYIVLILSYSSSLFINLYLLYLKKNKASIYKAKKMQKILKEPQSMIYLRELMKPRIQAPTSVMEKVKDKVVYSKFRGFNYSPRLICTMVVAGLALFKLSIEFTLLVDFLYNEVYTFYVLSEPVFASMNLTGDYLFFRDNFYIGRWSGYIGIWVSFALHVFFMVHMIISYRHHVRNYFKGDRSWHFEATFSPVSTMTASLRYSGYQIAYLLYGFLILGFLLTIIVCAFAILIALPIKYRYINWLIQLLIDFWPTIVLSISILIAQMLLSKFCLLQGLGKYMALNNRRFYHNVNYLLFFYNVIVGLFSCLRRILLSLVFGILLVSRLDRCLMMRGFERFDAGFGAYLGMLTVEVYHNHPVLKSFVYILWQSIEKDCDRCIVDDSDNYSTNKNKISPEIAVKYSSKLDKENALENGVKVSDVSIVWPERKKRTKQWRNKWFKAVTLINNPSLRLDLLKEDVAAAKKENKHKIRDFIIERAADVTSGVIVGAALAEITRM